MKLSLVISTYERPDALAAVLASVASQSRLPDELIVADDGSGASTAAVIASWARRLRCPTQHRWQPKRGFRLTRLRNMAIAAASGDYLVFVDGDMLLHPDFIADHAMLARAGFFTQGVRIQLNETLTRMVLTTDALSGVSTPAQPLRLRPWMSGLGLLRRLYLLRSPLLARLLRRCGNWLISIKGCNQGFWRTDLLRVNGFDETMTGWGPEDKEMCARLTHAGVMRQSLLAGGIAFHLTHPPASRDAIAGNRAVLAETLALKRIRCEHGLDAHLR